MTQQFKHSIIYITIFVLLISFLIGCGEDDAPTTLTPNYLPIEVGNYWTFFEPSDPENLGTISITGTTKLSNGQNVFIATTSDEYGSYGQGYLSRATKDLLLFHKALTDLQGELIYSPPIKVGTTWQGIEGAAEVVTKETVNTPAGIFRDCFRIDVRVDEYSEYEYYAIWLAKNVGPVKLSGIDRSDGIFEYSIVLKSFSTGRSVEEDQGLSRF